jgi:hypothetical protein
MRPSTWLAVGLLLSTTPIASLVSAAPNSPQRVRAFARLPDWNGMWETSSSTAITNPAGQTGTGSFANLKLVEHPPYNPEWEQKYQAVLKDPVFAAKMANTIKGCGAGAPASVRSFPNIMEAPMVFQVVVTPEETLFVMDHGEVRHIYTDGRAHPDKDDLWPTLLGDSVGHWKGETLVIDTIARTAGPISMFGPAQLSEQAHFTERLRRIDKNTLEDQLTIEDPASLLRPWTITLRYDRVQDLDRFILYDCDSDRNPVENDKLIIAPP